jgi:hypothetical protein
VGKHSGKSAMQTYTATQLSFFPWIVSTDTLRVDHLADRFGSALADLKLVLPEPFHSDLAQAANHAGDPVGPEPCEAWDHALEAAQEMLSEAAPAGFYFGASEGDGACFGFWLSEEWGQALDHLGFGNDDPTGWASVVAELIAGGIEPDSIEDSYQGRAEGWNQDKAGQDFAQQLAEETGVWSGAEVWPLSCIDWEQAWRELELGDGFWLQDIGGGEWLVFRGV